MVDLGPLAPMADEEVAAELSRLDAFTRAFQPPPGWLLSRSRSEFDALTAEDVEWIDRQWRDAGGTDVVRCASVVGPARRDWDGLFLSVLWVVVVPIAVALVVWLS